jgi:glycerol-3-phosphate dehydrogenase (NAD(P)+)
VAALVCRHNPTLLWARNGADVEEINTTRRHTKRLGDVQLPRRLRATTDLEEAVSDADVVVVGVPTSGFRETVAASAPFVRPWVPVVSLSKGFEAGTMKRMTEIVTELLPGHPVAALSGPNLAKEIMAGSAAASVIATADQEVAMELQSVLGQGMFRIYRNHDVIGCEVAGALKNVVAVATGMAQGLSVGDNTRGAVITRGLSEITRVGVALGAEPLTFAGLAGMGDLITTCISPLSRNRFVGEQLGIGRPLDEVLAGMTSVAEGVRTAPVLRELAERLGLELPVCGEVWRVVAGEITPNEAYRGLELAAGHENEPG